MAVCVWPYIPKGKAMGESYIRIFLWSFLLVLYFFGDGIAENMVWFYDSVVLDSPVWAYPKSCVDAFTVSEYHQYHLQLVILLNISQIKSLHASAMLIALRDSRWYNYRRSALLLVLFCSSLPALTVHRCLDSCRVLSTDTAFFLCADKEGYMRPQFYLPIVTRKQRRNLGNTLDVVLTTAIGFKDYRHSRAVLISN